MPIVEVNWNLSLYESFIICQAVIAFFAVLYCALFFFQFFATCCKEGSFAAVNIKRRLHIIGLLSALILLTEAIDPYGLFGLYPRLTLYLLCVNLNGLLLVALLLISWTNIYVIYHGKFKKVPEWLTSIWQLAGLLAVVGGNVCAAVAVEYQHPWVTSIYMLYSGGVVAVAGLSLILSHSLINHDVSKANSYAEAQESADGQSKSKDKLHMSAMNAKMIVIILCCCAIAPLQIWLGLQRLHLGDHQEFVGPNLERFDFLHNSLSYLGQIVCLTIIFAYAKIPLCGGSESDSEKEHLSDDDVFGGSSSDLSINRQDSTSQRRR